ADTHSRLSEPDAANVAKPHDDPTAHRVADLRAQSQPTDEPPAVDVAPIAKLTVRDGLVQRAGLYAPGLPDGDHDVFPVPLSPKGELRPHVLAEPPAAIPPSTQSKSDAQIAAELQTNMDAMIEPTDERERQCYRRLIRIM